MDPTVTDDLLQTLQESGSEFYGAGKMVPEIIENARGRRISGFQNSTVQNNSGFFLHCKNRRILKIRIKKKFH
ncbi:hypothetical protein [Acidiplasma sp.]|uniref:hypothetical protein n=1 Tax=Acidiplasma sp. TaxID=1872114 RepID=UPI00258F1CD1|nr:hypothetical protein [Acidiplasma sp.]